MLIFKRPVGVALGLGAFMLAFYVPAGYFIDMTHVAAARAGADALAGRRVSLDVEMLTVGAIAENCFLLRREGSDRVLVVDPGEEAERILAAGRGDGPRSRRSCSPTATSTTSAPSRRWRRRPGRRSTAREIEVPVLADIMRFVPWAGFGPYESYDADETVERRRDPGAGRARARRHLHPRAQPRPRHLLGPRRGRALLRRRPLPGVGRPGRPAGRRRADADGVDPRACSTPIPTRPSSIPATWGSRRWAPSAPPTRSSPRWPGRPAPLDKVAATMASKYQAPRGTFDVLPEQAAGARAGSSAPRRRSSPAPATSRSRRRPSRTPSCSSAASAAPPTSSARRCSPSRTRAGAA